MENNMKCSVCGKFISYEDIAKSEYIPDSEYTIEKIDYKCKKCASKEE